MKTKTIIILAAVLILSSFTATFSEEKAKEENQKEISNTYQASCILKITASSEMLPPESIDKNIGYILRSSPVGGKAAREILGFRPEPNDYSPFRQNINVYIISSTSSSDDSSFHTMRLVVYFPDAKPAAEEFMSAIVEQLRVSLQKEFEQYSKQFEQRLDTAFKNARGDEEELRTLQNRLRRISGSYNLNRENILENITNLRESLNHIQRRMNEYDFMLNEFSEQIALARNKIVIELQNDEVLKELEKIVGFQKNRLDMVKKFVENDRAGASADAIEIAEAEEKLAKAKIDIAQRKEQIRISAGGEKIANINQRIVDISMKKSMDKIRSRTIHQELSEAEDILNRADDYEIVSLKIDIAKDALKDALWLQSELKSNIPLTPPTITIVGSE